MDGIIIVDKPKECTSHDIVSVVKKITKEKVGHTGTLDPNATGVLPLLIGDGTKISKYLINHDKEYVATIELGKKTDTMDSEGNIIETREVNKESINRENIENVLESFKGIQEQVPPIYSAIKVNGKKLYEYARKGIEVKINSRKIEIYDIKLLNVKEKEITINVKCSKGTYIRSLCNDIAEKIGTVGFMKELRRVQVGIFNLDYAVNGQEILQNKNNENYREEINKKLITIEEVFKDKDKIILNQKEEKLYLNGVKIDISKIDGVYNIYDFENKYMGLRNC